MITRGKSEKKMTHFRLLESLISFKNGLNFRVSQNFKHKKLIWDQADSYSLRKRNAEKCKNYQNPTPFKGAR